MVSSLGTSLGGLGCLLSLLALSCEKVPARAVETKPQRKLIGPAQPAPTQRATSTHLPRERAWRLHPQSPFKLVGEGLRHIADLRAINGAMVIVGEPCSAPPGYQTAPPTDVRVAVGDAFAPALPALVTPEGTLDSAAIQDGSWPGDVWLGIDYISSESSYAHGGLVARWNGAAWQWFGPEGSFHPGRVFDWHDGSKLFTQYLARPHHGQSPKPFRVVGKTSQQPPDFSALPFDAPQGDWANSSVDYASLSTHELFVAYGGTGLTSFGIGRTTSAGNVVLDKVDVSPAAPGGASLVVGNLNGQERVIAWTKLKGNRTSKLWLRSYDRESFVQLPSPPSSSEEGYTQVWLAGGALWARQASKVWRADGSSWSKHATVPPNRAMTVSQDGTLWLGWPAHTLQRIDLQGQVTEVPLLDESTTSESMLPGRLAAGATADDMWLETSDGKETLLFRTRPMTNMLWCD